MASYNKSPCRHAIPQPRGVQIEDTRHPCHEHSRFISWPVQVVEIGSCLTIHVDPEPFPNAVGLSGANLCCQAQCHVLPQTEPFFATVKVKVLHCVSLQGLLSLIQSLLITSSISHSSFPLPRRIVSFFRIQASPHCHRLTWPKNG